MYQIDKINTRGNMNRDVILDILEEFQILIFVRIKRRMSTEEIEEFLDHCLGDMSFIEE